MKACSPAMRTASNRKRITPRGRVSQARSCSPRSTARLPAMKSISRWPAKQVRPQPDGERERPQHEVGEHLQREDQDQHRPTDALGDQALDVPDGTVGPHPFDVVCDEHAEREHERDREVRHRGIDLEGRDVRAEQLERVLGVDRQGDVADQVRDEDEDEQREDDREPFLGPLFVHVVARHLFHERVPALHGHLQTPWALLHVPRDVHHDPDRDDGREQQVQNALVELDRAGDPEPLFEVKAVDHLEVFVFVPLYPEADRERHEPHHVDEPDAQEELAGFAHPPRGLRRVLDRAHRATSRPRWRCGPTGEHPDRERDRIGGEDHERRREAVGAAADDARQDDRAGQQPDPPEGLEQVQAELRPRRLRVPDPAPVGLRDDPLHDPRSRPDREAEGGRPECQRHGRRRRRRGRRRDSAGSSSSCSRRNAPAPPAREDPPEGVPSRDVHIPGAHLRALLNDSTSACEKIRVKSE